MFVHGLLMNCVWVWLTNELFVNWIGNESSECGFVMNHVSIVCWWIVPVWLADELCHYVLLMNCVSMCWWLCQYRLLMNHVIMSVCVANELSVSVSWYVRLFGGLLSLSLSLEKPCLIKLKTSVFQSLHFQLC